MLIGYNLCSNLGPKGIQDYMLSAIASLIEGYLHIIYLFLFMAGFNPPDICEIFYGSLEHGNSYIDTNLGICLEFFFTDTYICSLYCHTILVSYLLYSCAVYYFYFLFGYFIY